MTSDRQGFEYVELGPQRLPGAPATYLDVYPSGSTDPSYGFELLDVGGRAFVRYSQYLRINPNDSLTNRGAYLSAGFLAMRALPVLVAANCIDLVSQIVGHLKSQLGPDNSVGRNFRLADYTYNGDLSESVIARPCSPLLLLDVLMQGLNGQGALAWKGRRPIFIDSARLTREEEIDKLLFYFGKGTPGAQLRLERDREKLKRLTRQLAHAASYADQVQDEWLSYQSLMQQRLPAMAARGTELRDLIDEVERLTESVDGIGGSRGTAAPRSAGPPQPAPAGAVYPGPWMKRPRIVTGRAHRFPAGSRHDRRSRRTLRRKFRPLAVGIGAALLLTTIAALTFGLLGNPFVGLDESETPASAVEGVPGRAPPAPGESETGDGAASTSPAGGTNERTSTGQPGSASERARTAEPPGVGATEAAPSSVAEERAALGQPRSE